MEIAKSTNVYPKELPMANQSVDGVFYWAEEALIIHIDTISPTRYSSLGHDLNTFLRQDVQRKFQGNVTPSAMMPEDNVDAFKIMIGWLNNGVIVPNIGSESENISSMALVELLILAEKSQTTLSFGV
ncbi:hypothetical protein OCU04_006623 [Sclerotinia nivalis]|uniref:Uncharacterized protein n=1 Tax=Sclerotinia nivalis TaxID=352851 RepID=A0A9X0DJU2_9HELO|nr:hypothetical protein OCU04_006623 [Sclerotinia nivalis]